MYKTIPLTTMEQVKVMWPQCKEYVQKALSFADDYNEEDILKEILQGESVLWVCLDEDKDVVGVATTCIQVFPKKKKMFIHLVGGRDFREWMDQLSVIEDTAKLNGCDCVEMYSRPAMTKLITGYKTNTVILTKDI